MYKSKLLLLLLSGCICSCLFGQENIRSGAKEQVLSPEVHPDNSVTFRLVAPDATRVFLKGNWTTESSFPDGKIPMVKSNSIWSYTASGLPSDLFLYNVEIDGVLVNDPLNVYQIRDVNRTFNYFITNGERADLYKVQEVPHGTVAKRWYDSPTLGMTRRMTVYTPPGYEEGKEKYPVLYLLHGMGGDEEAWPTLGRAAQILDNMIARGQVKPMIVAMPNGHVSNTAAPGESSKGLYPIAFATPDVGTGKMEESFIDVVRFIEENYRVQAKKSSRAIAGLSMGGSHTLFTSAFLPDYFDYIGLFSAAFRMNDKAQSPVFSDFDHRLTKQKENGYRLYWIGMGKDDFLYETGQQFRKKLEEHGMMYHYHESEGGHTWSNWRTYLTLFLPKLFQ
jgi:enterochelin esterase-like enzyme